MQNVSKLPRTVLNPKVDTPLFAATVAPLQHYQVDRVHQPLGLSVIIEIITSSFPTQSFDDNLLHTPSAESFQTLNSHCVSSPLGDKVSMLTHIYPHKAGRKIEVIICKITRLTAHFMCGLMSDLLICTCL